MLSTWLGGSLGIIESLDKIKPVELTIGDDVRALTKTRITIHCPSSGRPTPFVTWRRNGQVITNNEDYKLLGGVNNSLVILNSSEAAHSGLFQCTATNFLGNNSASSAVRLLGR